MAKKRVLSGIQPSGLLHIGNYLGALRPFVELQDKYDCYYFLADLHAITVPQKPDDLRQQIIGTASAYLACGLDLEKATLFRQSDVPAHAELGWILTTLSTMGELRRMTQFKDKSGKASEEGVGVGLFTYPSLMAADILLYEADLVPVGEDQKQHVELTRDLAERFNHRFGEVLRVPQPLIRDEAARIMGLDDPGKKMSKSAASEYNYIALTDSADVIKQKISKAVTDSGSQIKAGPDKPAVTNLLTIFSGFSGKSVGEIESNYADSGYAKFKADLAATIIEGLAPIQQRLGELRSDSGRIEKILEDGKAKAEPVAEATLAKAKQAIGLA